MSGRLDGARVIVTGASRGIGRAVAEAVAAEGGRLVVTATRRANLDGLLGRLAERGAEAHGLELDLGDGASVDAAAAEAVAALGRVEGLVNNAGLLGERRPLADYPLDLWERVMAANVTGTLRLTQARAARDVARRGGRERHLGGRRPPDLGRLRHLEARPGRDHLDAPRRAGGPRDPLRGDQPRRHPHRDAGGGLPRRGPRHGAAPLEPRGALHRRPRRARTPAPSSRPPQWTGG